ncbi:hypothetical protein SteCoe_14426 [Stentor coeruleus]|uniref:HTH cro/C1-type domain-containing protein n=1 Tax=Stentor coeruleus TaxID=5963 RepID=A0A1R2C670_9CILI|nr:hypothetical protein SteCoe_14426 [Stentor coeruleus]
MLPHQDWNKVQFTGPVGKAKKGEKAVQDAHRKGVEVETVRKHGATNANRGPAVNMRKLADETDVIPVAELPHEFRMAMQKARVAANLSQADLAKRINEKQSVVNDYENGRAVPNPQVIVKIERALNCRLPRPPKEKKLKQNEDI